jgi:TPR repeat protein
MVGHGPVLSGCGAMAPAPPSAPEKAYTDTDTIEKDGDMNQGVWGLLAAVALAGAVSVRADEMTPAERHTALAQAVQIYERGDFAGAELRFTALANAGEPAAWHNLAVMHLRGEVPQASVTKARELLLRAADHGFVTATLALGELYESGRLGAPDLPQALAWYQRAADSGSVDAQVATATAYFMGRGTGRDAAQAAHWYRKAANGGDVGAQYILGSMYEKGDGVAADLRLARYWYAAAARQGDEAAPAKLKEIDARLATQ